MVAMAVPPSLNAEKRHWWLSNKKIVDKYIKDAKSLIQTQNPSNINSALSLLDSALTLSPRLESALELKARSLLFLRRFREVADMLQDFIPSYKMVSDDESSNSSNSGDNLRERAKLLKPSEEKDGGDGSFRCFSVAGLKKKVMAGLNRNCNKEGQWRYLILGQACAHLGLMEDAMVLLQTARRLATATFRRECISRSDDIFKLSNPIQLNTSTPNQQPPQIPTLTESESASHLLAHIKLLLRRRTAALAALDAGLPSESIRHFSKILDGRRGTNTPSTFVSMCFINRSAAYKAVGRITDAIADCNRALALDPASIPALRARADLLESIRAIPDCLRDLDHLKLLYDSILRDRKLPGPAWKPLYDVRYRDIPSNLRALTTRIQELRRRVATGEGCSVDYYTLIGVRRGCTRSELERAHLLLSLKHKPDKGLGFIDRLEFVDEYRDLDAVRDQARMSASILYRMLQKGYSSIMSTVMVEEAEEKKRAMEVAAAAVAANVALQAVKAKAAAAATTTTTINKSNSNNKSTNVYQGVFCRDLVVVGSMLSQVGFSSAIPVKYEALSC